MIIRLHLHTFCSIRHLVLHTLHSGSASFHSGFFLRWIQFTCSPLKNSSTVSQSGKVSEDKKVRSDWLDSAWEQHWWCYRSWLTKFCVCVCGSEGGRGARVGQVFLCISACAAGVVHACVPLAIIGDPFNHESFSWNEISLADDTNIKVFWVIFSFWTCKHYQENASHWFSLSSQKQRTVAFVPHGDAIASALGVKTAKQDGKYVHTEK